MITNTILDVFARNLQELRKERGLSQEHWQLGQGYIVPT